MVKNLVKYDDEKKVYLKTNILYECIIVMQACILQRAADHIKSLENEKLKLQSQNEQFRILIKSFQIDSTSILQGQRRLSTNGNLLCFHN